MSEKALQESIYACRGRILQMVIEMETMIDTYIGEYFISDEEKRKELWILIISPRVELMAKKDILEYLLKKDPTNGKEEIKALIKSIGQIIEERNIFAHWPISFSKEALERFEKEKIITFVKLKPGKYKESEGSPSITALGLEYFYHEEKVNAWLNVILEVNKILKKLINP